MLFRRLLVIIPLLASLSCVAIVRADETADARKAIEADYVIWDAAENRNQGATMIFQLSESFKDRFERQEAQAKASGRPNVKYEKMSPAQKEAYYATVEAKLQKRAVAFDESSVKYHMKNTKTVIKSFYRNGNYVHVSADMYFQGTSRDPSTGKETTTKFTLLCSDGWIKHGKTWQFSGRTTSLKDYSDIK